MRKFKYFLGYENSRNFHHGKLFVALIKHAFGAKEVVTTGHHFVCDRANNLKTLNEIPSADTLIFDHDIMTEVFGAKAIEIMVELAKRPVPQRDDYLLTMLKLHKPALWTFHA